MFKLIKKLFAKQRPVEEIEVCSRMRTDEEIEDDELEIKEMLILSDPSWFGDIARKHHG